jgi:hypothetical protein
MENAMRHPNEMSMTLDQRDMLIPLDVLKGEVILCAKRAKEARDAYAKLPATTPEGQPVTGAGNNAMSEIERYWNVRFLAAQRLLWPILGGFSATDKWLEAHGIERPRMGYIVP